MKYFGKEWYNDFFFFFCLILNMYTTDGISNELYLNDNSCEFHLMADVWSDVNDRFSHKYFTVKCSNIELLYGNKSFKIFDEK